VGKVWLRPGGATVNAFAEPQFTVAHDGAAAGVPGVHGLEPAIPAGEEMR